LLGIAPPLRATRWGSVCLEPFGLFEIVSRFMLLAVDVGNTQTHFGTFCGDELREHWRFATVRQSTSDQLGAALRNLLELRHVSMGEIDASIVSSTVPVLGPEWCAMAKRYLGHEMLVVGPGVKTAMPIRYDNPREIGPDRLVNAVAAHARLGGPCIVVDFGTAITYDAVSAAGEYLGGIITPGAEISIDALYERAAKLPKVELAEPRSLIGKSTVDAIRSGIVYGFAGQVEGIVRRLRDELGEDTTVIATGGLAAVLVPFTRDTIDEVDDLLTLIGLRLIWGRNQD
jgi:type III pantothenate kinase